MNAIEEDLLGFAIGIGVILLLIVVGTVIYKCHCYTLLGCWYIIMNCCCCCYFIDLPPTDNTQEEKPPDIIIV